jgi:hypothetical protein
MFQDKASKVLRGCLAEGLIGLVLVSGIFKSIDADEADGG